MFEAVQIHFSSDVSVAVAVVFIFPHGHRDFFKELDNDYFTKSTNFSTV